jgi:HEAT repeat protein
LKFCDDNDTGVRGDAAWTLWKITSQTNTAVPVLESVLSQAAGREDRTTYHLLLMGDASPLFVATLIGALTSRQAGDRAIVCSFLRDIGPPAAAAIPALRKALLDPEPEVRRCAEVALSRIDPGHAPTPAP